ncbi:MAG: DUF3883 domain-containing protein [Caldilineaceae bacterium]|nr:DUF3883 domain-containing protein [Caldilineaceae bacterium]
MAIPKLHDVTLPILQQLADAGGELPHSVLVDQLAKQFNLTEAERELRNVKGGNRVFANSRIGWAKVELKLAGLVVYSKGGPVRLTDVGWMVLESKPRKIDSSFLNPLKEYFAKQKGEGRVFEEGLRALIPQDVGVDKSADSSVWTERENYAIVSDYLAMLEYEQQGITYDKTEYTQALIETTGRSNESIEFKHRNISEAMGTLGLPWINGYTPLKCYQRSLHEAVKTHFEERPDLFAFLTGEAENLQELNFSDSIGFDNSAPPREPPEQEMSEEFEALMGRFGHPAERDARNKKLGTAGEQLVFEFEKRRLLAIGQDELSDRVRWIAKDKGDGLGYDILSFCGKGDQPDRELWLEVKTTNGSATTPFFITENELRVSNERPDVYRIVRLYDFRKQARAFYLTPPLDKEVTLIPSIFKAYF